MTNPPALSDLMHPSWAEALEPVTANIHQMDLFCRDEIMSGRGILPDGQNVLRAFSRSLEEVRVLLLGQDPYPTPGNAVGLSFSMSRETQPIPRSLVNIYDELWHDLGIPPAPHGDLTAWFEQGVLLMNRVLTVQPHSPASHRGLGWEVVTDRAITALIEHHAKHSIPLTAILWGNDAKRAIPQLEAYGVPYVASAHPSPLSAHRGFFGSTPFSRTNDHLTHQGGSPIDWKIPA